LIALTIADVRVEMQAFLEVRKTVAGKNADTGPYYSDNTFTLNNLWEWTPWIAKTQAGSFQPPG
jgi:hypothetical protein